MPIELPGKSGEIQSQNQSNETHDTLWYSMMTECMRILAYHAGRDARFVNVRNQVVLSKDVATTVDLIDLSQELVEGGNKKGNERLWSMANGLVRYITEFRISQIVGVNTFDEYLTEKNFKISELMANFIAKVNTDTSQNINIIPEGINETYPDGASAPSSLSATSFISSDNTFPEGFWQVDHILESYVSDCSFYNLLLEISDQEDYSNIIHSIDTRNSTDNWTIEIKDGVFAPLSDYISSDGIGEKFVNNIVRYVSPENQYLNRAQTYYLRIYQITDTETFGPTEYEDVIYT